VTRFVEALETELEATFKEDISVYFDENPHLEAAKNAVALSGLRGGERSLSYHGFHAFGIPPVVIHMPGFQP